MRSIHFARDTFCRVSAARKIELVGIAPVPFSDNKEEKSGNVLRTVQRNGSSDDIVRSASTTSRNKENGRIPLSCDSLCLKRVPQPRLVFIISRLPVPRCQDTPLSWMVSFSESCLSHIRYPLFYPRASSLSPYVFSSFFICITIQASAFIAYSILACKIIYIYIPLYESRIEV